MNVVFRVDASPRIGGGHLERCLALAEALEECGARPRFVCRETGAGRAPDNFALTSLSGAHEPARDAEQTLHALHGERPEWLVVDHYALGLDWERRVRPAVGGLLAIDDMPGRRHDCDAFLDQNALPPDETRYADLLPEGCRLLLGPKYALLRGEFRAARARLAPRRGRLERILIFLTAGDDGGETVKAMQGVELHGKARQVDVVVGTGNATAEDIAHRCGAMRWGFHRQVDTMAELIAGADLVIGAGGSSSWERCALGAPALVTVLAENQVPIALALERAGAAVSLGWRAQTTPQKYREAIEDLDERSLAEMSAAAFSLVDGMGAQRAASFLSQERVS